jgi:transcription termination factor 2
MKAIEMRGSGGFLCDSMGLGKTVTMSMFLITNKYRNKPDLIVCPCSLITTWTDWLGKVRDWDGVDRPKPKVLVYHGVKRRPYIDLLDYYDFIVTTYATISTGELAEKTWGRVVLDESHNIKNALTRSGAKCAKAAVAIGARSRKNWCITGTPFCNRMQDLASQAKFVGTAPFNEPSWWKANGTAQNLDQWRKLFVIRRTKETMMAPPLYHDVYVDPTPTEIDLVDALRKQAADEFAAWKKAKLYKDKDERIRLQGVLLGLIQKLRIYSNSYYSGMDGLVDVDDVLINNAKVERIINDIDRVIDREPRKGIVVFSQFTSFLRVFEQVIEVTLAGIEVMRFFGDMSQSARDQVVERFNTQRNPRIILVSLMAGGCGLSLHHGSSSVFVVEPYYNPFLEQQAEERVHRLGQTEQVNVYRYYMNNSVENWIYGLKQKKLLIAGSMNLVAEDRVPTEAFSMDDIADLFKVHVAFYKAEDVPEPTRSAKPIKSRCGSKIRI